MIETIHIKSAATDHAIEPLIARRWSPRSFSDKTIEEKDLMRLFEAARWAPSANNEQPWKYLYASRGTQKFEKIWEHLLPGNQPWTKNASTFVVAIKRNTFEKSGKLNLWADHDLGMANNNLILQAAAQDIYGHFMAGILKDQLHDTLDLGKEEEISCVIALGYRDEADKLEEPYRTRELTKRSRKKVEEFVTQL